MFPLFDLLTLRFPELKPKQTKIHLASHNGIENPLDVYLQGSFEEWQGFQNQRNFERPFILSLIQLPEKNHWLFAGIHRSLGSEFSEKVGRYLYETEEVEETMLLNGRVVVEFSRSGRMPYLVAENWIDRLAIVEIKPERMVVESFPGYRNTCIPKSTLDLVVNQSIESWRSALSNVAGVYLITDTQNGKLYVGSATGEGGIWQRWVDYSKSGHGGNQELKLLLKTNGAEHAKNFQFSILEIADTHATVEDVLKREIYWKNVLKSRDFGYNGN